MKRGKVVAERRGRAAETHLQPPDLRDPAFDHARLARKTYLTVPEIFAYIDSPAWTTLDAVRTWLRRSGVPIGRLGQRTIIVLRRDVDDALQPVKERGHLDSFSKGA